LVRGRRVSIKLNSLPLTASNSAFDPPLNYTNRRDTGRRDDQLCSGAIDLAGPHDPVAAFKTRQEAAARELERLFVEEGYGQGLRELRLGDNPTWLDFDRLNYMLRHTPRLEALEVCLAHGSTFGFDVEPVRPSLRRLTLRLNGCFLPQDAPIFPTLEAYGSDAFTGRGMPPPSPALEHFRYRGSYKGMGVGGWSPIYPNLRLLDVQMPEHIYSGHGTFVDGAFLLSPCACAWKM
jgi:hypothetical protein